MKLHQVKSNYLNSLLNNNYYNINNVSYYDSNRNLLLNNVSNKEKKLENNFENNFENKYERRGLNNRKIILHNKLPTKKLSKRKKIFKGKKTCKNINPTLREFLSRRFI